MHLLSADALAKAYEGRPLFEGVTFGLATGDRMGVVGANGAGKSTLLRIVAGLEVPDAGQVVLNRETTVAYLPQEAGLPLASSVLDAVLDDSSPAVAAVLAYERAAAAVAAAPGDPAAEAVLAEAGTLLETLDGWVVEHRARAVLDQLGLGSTTAVIGELSGGQRRRVALARALLSDANLLVLDEPTNHLDPDTVDWLEGELARRQGALLLVTHDRYFLERLTNRMLELDNGGVFKHEGAYSAVLEARARREEAAERAEGRRQNLLRTELAWLRRQPKARTSKPRFRVEQAEALASASAPGERVALQLGTGRQRLGKRAVAMEGVGFAYGDRPVLRDVDLELGPGDRIGVVGPNGSGKTTLLRLIAGELEPSGGKVWRSPTVHTGHYRQDTIVEPVERKVIDLVTEVAEWLPLEGGRRVSASAMCERFLFDSAMQHRSVSLLSGGERRRLALLRVLVDAPNVLLLDEPTNDLDLDTLSVLEGHLDGFGGVLVVASHDRFLLNRLCDHFVAIEADGTLRRYPGDWDSYVEMREASRAQARTEAGRQGGSGPARERPPSRRLSYKERRELDRLDDEVERLEARKAQLSEALAGAGSDYEAAIALSAELDEASAALAAAEERWLELTERAEELAGG